MFVRRDIVPMYNTRYRFKGELNWYFDLVEQSDFTFERLPVAVVDYEFGGWGYEHFLRNRWDWLRLVTQRYGVKAVWQSGLPLYLWKNSFFRYPWLRKVHTGLTWPVQTLQKVKRKLFK